MQPMDSSPVALNDGRMSTFHGPQFTVASLQSAVGSHQLAVSSRQLAVRKISSSFAKDLITTYLCISTVTQSHLKRKAAKFNPKALLLILN
jgi:hypothetical protein